MVTALVLAVVASVTAHAARTRDPTGSRYFNEDRTTILAVTLDSVQGGIARRKVHRPGQAALPTSRARG